MKPEANENFRKIATTLARCVPPQGSATTAFSSVDYGGGSTTVILNVARHLKECCELLPLVVELNVKRPVLAKMFKLDADRSTVAVAEGRHAPAECVQMCGLGFPVIPAGRYSPRNGLEPDLAGTLRRIVDALGHEYRVILVDTPPILKAASALAVALVATRLVLVVEAGRTRVEMLERVKSELDQAGIQLVGSILNKHRRFIPGWAYRMFVK